MSEQPENEDSYEYPQLPEPVLDLTPWYQLPGVTPPMICNVSPISGQFLGQGLADPSPLEPGVWLLPAHAFQLSPPDISSGLTPVIAASGDQWSYVADYRGSTVYNTLTRDAVKWDRLGVLPDSYTLEVPNSAFDVWNGQSWVLDKAARTAELTRVAARKKALLVQYTANKINTLQSAVDLDMATAAEKDALKAWKAYSVYLDRIDPSKMLTSTDWPISPNNAAMEDYLESQGFEDGSQ